MNYQCTIHNVRFDCEPIAKVPIKPIVECPLCLQEQLNALRADYAVVKSQRNTLVDALSIVNTVKIIG